MFQSYLQVANWCRISSIRSRFGAISMAHSDWCFNVLQSHQVNKTALNVNPGVCKTTCCKNEKVLLPPLTHWGIWVNLVIQLKEFYPTISHPHQTCSFIFDSIGIPGLSRCNWPLMTPKSHQPRDILFWSEWPSPAVWPKKPSAIGESLGTYSLGI